MIKHYFDESPRTKRNRRNLVHFDHHNEGYREHRLSHYRGFQQVKTPLRGTFLHSENHRGDGRNVRVRCLINTKATATLRA